MLLILCLYTLDKLKTILIDGINADERFTIQVASVENVRGGEYPACVSLPLVAEDIAAGVQLYLRLGSEINQLHGTNL